jgi:hypothetical protein
VVERILKLVLVSEMVCNRSSLVLTWGLWGCNEENMVI